MKPSYIFIHHTAVSYAKNADQWQATNNYHRDKIWGYTKDKKPIKTPISSLGFYGGYNYEIAANGSVKQFRKDGEQTVAQYQQNMNDGRAISICLDGNFDIEDPTPAQRAALAKLVAEKVATYQINPANVFPHRKVAVKTCPGKRIPNEIYDWIKAGGTPEVPDWAKPSMDKAIKAGVITGYQDAASSLSVSSIETILVKAGIFQNKENSITLMRLMVALDRLGVLESKSP